jgi:hypothetical protein
MIIIITINSFLFSLNTTRQFLFCSGNDQKFFQSVNCFFHHPNNCFVSGFTPNISVARIEAAWHLPLFLLPGSGQYGMPLLLFFLEIIAVSVFFTWVYINSSNSLWAVLLAHTGMNTAGYLISDVYKLDSSLSFNALFFIALLLTAIFIAVKTSQKKIEPARL